VLSDHYAANAPKLQMIAKYLFFSQNLFYSHADKKGYAYPQMGGLFMYGAY
jgi:hypothetical protein